VSDMAKWVYNKFDGDEYVKVIKESGIGIGIGAKWVYDEVIDTKPVRFVGYGIGAALVSTVSALPALALFGFSRLVRPLDPNEKIGPAGFGPSEFIAADGVLPYRIEFENEATATAPAHRVVVSDQLDANLDWDTFAWTAVGFGDVVLTIPAGSQHYQ